MKRIASSGSNCATRIGALRLGLAFVLAVFLAPASRADLKTDSQKQFERAVKMRTMLEGYLEKDRALGDYQQTVQAYRKVYLITPEAPDATQALIAEAELSEEMGRLFDAKFFDEAINRYNFLLKQYPGTRFRGDALLAIGKIQKDDLKKTDDAEATSKEFLQRYPRSDKSGDAQQALKEIAGQRASDRQQQSAQRQADQRQADRKQPEQHQTAQQQPNPKQSEDRSANRTSGNARKNERPENVNDVQPDLKGQAVEPRVSDQRTSSVTAVQTWNSQESTRVVVSLNDTIQYEAARIQSPDRIYFNLYKAKVGGKLAHQALDVDDGILKSVRVAQNKPDVVRIVLDVNGDKDYSAFLLANPYRLVIDIHRPLVKTAKTQLEPAIASAPVASRVARPAPPTAPVIAPATTAAVSSVLALPTAPAPTSADNFNLVTPASKIAAPPPVQPAAKVAEKTALPLSKNAGKTTAALEPPPEPKPTRDGQRSLTRALGLKINRIVIDAGHGGHDTGTIGPHGLMEKDLCLDVALRLGTLIEEKLPGAEVVYTRKDDTFIPLEERTAIANQAQADLFISIHANSSHDESARGVETYYLNFATTEESMQVASRENALSQESLHDLQNLIQKIARNDKIEESKELASDIQDSLTQRLQLVSHGEKNRGVKKAPFVVLIGANMPSILSEISFVSNPNDEKLLRKNDQRQRIADGLYKGISSYLDSLNSLTNNKQKLVSDNPADPAALAANGNPK